MALRLSKHKSNFNDFLKGNYSYVTSFEILKNNNYEIILVENYPCNSKDELHSKERFYIESNECVNKVIPTRTSKEWQKKNYQENKEKYAETMKQYREQNKEKLQEYFKQYREQNKDKIAENKKHYYETNKDKIAENKKQ